MIHYPLPTGPENMPTHINKAFTSNVYHDVLHKEMSVQVSPGLLKSTFTGLYN